MLTAQDLQNTVVFLKRTNLTGEESMTHAELLIKFSQMLQEAQQPPPPPAADPIIDPPPTADGPGVALLPPGNGPVIDPPPPAETPIDEAIEDEAKH